MQVTAEMKKMREQGAAYSDIALKMGVATNTVWESFRKLGTKNGKAAAEEQSRPGRSLSDFRKTYDKDLIVPTKIKAALKALGNSWVYEKEFVQQAGISFTDVGNYREVFADYIVTIRQDNKRVWAGTVKLANELKGIVS